MSIEDVAEIAVARVVVVRAVAREPGLDEEDVVQARGALRRAADGRKA
jgi:hypothetical protein